MTLLFGVEYCIAEPFPQASKLAFAISHLDLVGLRSNTSIGFLALVGDSPLLFNGSEKSILRGCTWMPIDILFFVPCLNLFWGLAVWPFSGEMLGSSSSNLFSRCSLLLDFVQCSNLKFCQMISACYHHITVLPELSYDTNPIVAAPALARFAFRPLKAQIV